MKKTKFGMITLLAALALGACGQSNEGGTGSTDTQESSTEAAGFDINDLQLAVENNDEVIDGGVLDVAVVTDTQFQGLFNGSFIKMLMTVISCYQAMNICSYKMKISEL